MSKKPMTTYVNVILRHDQETSGVVAAFEFDYTEDAIAFSTNLLGRLNIALLTMDEFDSISYDTSRVMRDYINIHVETCHSFDFDSVWTAVVNVCRICQAFGHSVTASSVIEFPYGY